MSEIIDELRDGLSQQERKLKALFPQNLKIDQQDGIDLLYQMFGLSFELNYYNLNDEIDGDWSDFFTKNYDILLHLTSKLDIAENEDVYLRIETAIQLAENQEQLQQAVQQLFNFIQKSTKFIKDIQRYFYSSNTSRRSFNRLKRMLGGFDNTIANFGLIYQHVQSQIPEIKIETYGLKSVKSNSAGIELDFPNLKTGSVRERINTYLPFIRENLDQIYTKFNNFLAAIRFFTNDHLQLQLPPHMALLTTFNHLYGHLQTQYNQLPQKHLDYYYEEILGLKKKEATLDHVNIIIEPELLTTAIVVEKDTLLVAEGDEQSDLYYAVDEDFLVTKARIEEVKLLSACYRNDLHLKDVGKSELQLYAANCPVFSIEDISNVKDSQSWVAFGEDQELLGYQEKTMELVALESVIASPVLYLPEGERVIALNVYITEGRVMELKGFIKSFASTSGISIEQANFELFSKAFTVLYTTAVSWVKISKVSISFQNDVADPFIKIQCHLSVKEAAFGIYTFGVHGDRRDVGLPALKLVINNDAPLNPLTFINGLQVTRLQISAKVIGFSSFNLFNNIGGLSTSNSFQLFGPQPNLGAFLDIKNTNVLNKYTKSISLAIDWLDLPVLKGGWETYYRAYPCHIKNDSFKVKIMSLNNGEVLPKKNQQQEEQLFQTYRTDEGGEYLKPKTVFDQINLNVLAFSNELSFGSENKIGKPHTEQGVLRLALSSPPEGFCNLIYPQLFSEVMMHNSKKFVRKREVPNAPYIPQIKSLLASYSLAQSVSFSQHVNEADSVMKIFHSYAHGFQMVYPKPNDGSISLFPRVEECKSVLIGVANVEPGQQLSLLFQLAENNFIDLATDSPAIGWSYLLESKWVKLQDNCILSDTTQNLIHSGIVKLRVPNDINFEHTILRKDLTWLRMTVAVDAKVFAKIKVIFANAVSVTRLRPKDTEPERVNIPANAIKGFKVRKIGIKKVWQPFASIKGWDKESQEEFYVRVSERLRNRNRLVTILDIEQFILREFPQLLMVKCFLMKGSPANLSASTLKVVIIGRINADHLNDQPKVNMTTMFEVHERLKSVLHNFSAIEVLNPTYEPVKIIADVKFNPTALKDTPELLNQLKDDIRVFFCPWLSKVDTEIKIGSKVFVSEIVKYIKNLPYVAHVTRFSMVHFYKVFENGNSTHQINDLAISKDSFLQGSVSEAILIPSEHHIIKVVANETFAYPSKLGIGEMIVGEELLVNHLKETSVAEEERIEEDYFDIVISNL